MERTAFRANPWRRIVLVTGESSASEPALRFCLGAAGRLGSEVTALYVARPASARSGPDAALGRRLAASAARRLAGEGVLARSHVVTAAAKDVPRAIAGVGESADLLVIGVEGRSPAAGFDVALGEGVIARCQCPVIAVPEGSIRLSGVIRRIMLAISDPPSPVAVATTVAAARAFGAGVVLWHGVHRRWAGRLRLRPAREPERLDAVRQILREREVECEVAAVETASAIPESLVKAAAAWPADLLVIGSGIPARGNGAPAAAIGSAVLRLTRVPVLVVPHHGFQCHPSRRSASPGLG
jgi:nucleotide-binding universal stress UspA family protein